MSFYFGKNINLINDALPLLSSYDGRLLDNIVEGGPVQCEKNTFL